MKRIIQLFTVVFILTIAVVQAVQADVFLKQRRHSEAVTIMGQTQPEENVVADIWITQEGIRSDSNGASTIMRLDERQIILLNHADKTYQVRPMDMDQNMQPAGKGQGSEENAAMQGMMKNMMKMDIAVTPTNATQTIKGWNCRKYRLVMDMMMGKTVNEVWATEDLKIDQKLYDRLNTAMLSAMPGMQQAIQEAQEEMEKIKGVQVKTISKQQIMGKPRTTTTELLEYKEGQAPADLLKIPAGYDAAQ